MNMFIYGTVWRPQLTWSLWLRIVRLLKTQAFILGHNTPFFKTDAPKIQRLTTVMIQPDNTNSLKSKLSDFGTTMALCTSIVNCWPVTGILLIPDVVRAV